MSLRTVCFLCTGNYYRSRFAEGLFNHLAGQKGLDWRACSRGLAVELTGTINIGPIAPQTLEAFRQRSITIAQPLPYPQAATLKDFRSADLIVALKEDEHRELVREQFPEWENRVTYWHVHDLDQAPAEAALSEIEALVRALVSRLASHRADSNPGEPG